MWIEGAVLLEIDGNCLRNLGLTLMISSFLLRGGVEAATNSQVFSLQDSEQRLVAKVARQL
jgi:hypothetical protein